MVLSGLVTDVLGFKKLVLVTMMVAILNLGIIHAIKSLLINRRQLFVPKYPTIDTKIMVLGGLVTEILGFKYWFW